MYYYDISKDLEQYNEAWCYIIIGGRNTGKTYGTLKHCVKNSYKFTYLKRTKDDVDMICTGNSIKSKNTSVDIDLSPFKSINRDIGTNFKAYSIHSGLGGFWTAGDEGAEGLPIGYILSLSTVQKFKGFDLSECSQLIFDEFIPQPWERVSRKEGEQLMDCYKTIARDREHRGLPALKLICLANPTEISSPTTNILEVTDILADMRACGDSVRYLEDRGILLRILSDNIEFQEREKQSAIYKAMGDTAWGRMAFSSEFSYNDFSNIGKIKLKGYKPVCTLLYKNDTYYVYRKEQLLYMCKSQHNSNILYDLNRESDQKRFYIDYVIDFRNECIDGNMTFQTYSMYDLIINYKKYFKI